MNSAPGCLPDHAAEADHRNIALDRVGIRGLAYPIVVWDRANQMQSTVARIDATVSLPASAKGTHMSRFIEIINEVRGELSLNNLEAVLIQIQAKLQAETAQLDVSFPYFLEKKAPVSGARSLMEYKAAFHASRTGEKFDFELEVQIPVTTLCPCSKAVSERGAHNQRSWVTVLCRAREPFLWIEEVIELVEACASSPLYAVLKREDEKYVTEAAYDNPRFVEDLIREVISALEDRTRSLQVSVENLESIHNHSAWASTTRIQR
jgi:GTP cyclohydrolase I